MSARLVQDAIDHSRAEGTAFQLLLVMAHYASFPGRTVWRQAEDLAEAAHVPVRTLYHGRRKLLELGEIIVAKTGGGRGRQTAYELVDLPSLYSAVSGRDSGGANPAVSGRDSGAETLPKPCQNPATLTRGRDSDRRPLTPPSPPKGGNGDRGNVLEWESILTNVSATVEQAGGQALQLQSLEPVRRDDGVLVLGGPSARHCAQRYGSLIAASAAHLGVAIEFAPPPTTAGRRPRRQRSRAA